MEMNIEEEQFGFRRRKGTRESIGLPRMIGERYTERGKGVSLGFFHIRRSFQTVKWDQLIAILKKI